MKSKTDKIVRLIRPIDGFLTDREAMALYALAAKCQDKGIVVEVGSWKGKSTVCLARGLPVSNIKKIYAIDPHIGSSEHQRPNEKVWTFEEFKENIRRAQVDQRIVPLIQTSQAARQSISEPVELLFIDGAHEYDFVKMDYDLWFPLLIRGGTIIFHDLQIADVKKVVHECFLSEPIKKVNFVDTIVYGQKAERISRKDRWRTKVMLGLREEFEQACRSPAPKVIRTLWKNRIKFVRSLVSLL